MLEQRRTELKLLRIAINHHQAGEIDQAFQICHRILKQNPNESDTLRLLGLIEFQRGNLDKAQDLIVKSLELNPNSSDGHYFLARVFWGKRRIDQAVSCLKKSIEIEPDHENALTVLGGIHAQTGNEDEAIKYFTIVSKLNPRSGFAWFNLAFLLQKHGQYDEALACYDKAIELRNNDVEALCGRGVTLYKLNRTHEAITCFDRALAIKPDHVNAWFGRGVAFYQLAQYQRALDCYDRALAINSDNIEALNGRGLALDGLNRHAEALASYDKALAIKPDYAGVLSNRGGLLLAQGQIGDAIACFQRALAIEPDNGLIHTDLIFSLNFDPTATTADHQAERAKWNERHARRFVGQIQRHANNPDPQRRLRVGYVSSHFRSQAATYAFGGVLTSHDHESFDVVCYSDTVGEDDETARLRACATMWRQTGGLTDDKLAELIRADGIDILVDLVGHMLGNRLLVFARKPAPVQVTGWGEPTGTGLATMDYLLADRVLVPQSDRALISEQVLNLPNFLCFWAPEPIPEPRPLPALARRQVTFGSFNRLAKLHNPVLVLWAKILRAVPQARLVLKESRFGDEGLRARVLSVLAGEGVTADQVTLLAATDRRGHFAAYQDIDIALDPFPHGGGMTTLDALWMGVPVVTTPGRTISSRLAAASITAVGLTDFLAVDLDNYVQVAVEKANNLDALAHVRASLRQRMIDSAIGEPARYTRAVEAVYREIWQRWCTEQRTTRVTS